MPLHDHDALPGKLDRCQITGSRDLFQVIDLGHQAPCDSMLTKPQLDEPEKTYPLRLNLCPESGLAQLDYVVDGREIYHPDYPYRSGVTKPLREYQQAFAEGVVARLGTERGSFVVDIGSNDGTLLTGFRACGMSVLGIEPTNIAEIAKAENGIDTRQAFFSEHVGELIAGLEGKAKIVTATNVFAHMADLGSFCRGLCHLLDDDGVFVVENHYLLDVLDKRQFDTVYHEHIRTYSLKALVTLFDQYGLEVFDVERASRYGGNIRAYVGRRGVRDIEPSVAALRKIEDDRGLFDPETWELFRSDVQFERDRFMEFLWREKKAGRRIAAQACPGRCATLLNYYGVTRELLPYIAEQDGSLKVGLYLPGSHIPVVSQRMLLADQPHYVIINAWHYGDVIRWRLRELGVVSTFLLALPTFRMLH